MPRLIPYVPSGSGTAKAEVGRQHHAGIDVDLIARTCAFLSSVVLDVLWLCVCERQTIGDQMNQIVVGSFLHVQVSVLVKFTADGINRRHVVAIEFTCQCIGKGAFDNVLDHSATLGLDEDLP